MKWVTRSHVHVDRVACPWLIKRFVDNQAEFIFVTRELVMETAKRENAIPFDVKGVELGHKDGHCSFVSIMEKYKITDPTIKKLAEIINAADTGHPEASEYAAGMELIARGFSIMYPDDMKNLEEQFKVYDAVYAALKTEK
ncbi:chromate resistance protein ChrB domain-containing protein [Mesoaciditoga lauensis]|uniref:chromate resistance protein ChrB domain-containing protein n=1 Tax=Mesoaciditoga lauensis TaxID=1495039 RepID=UPI000AB11C4A|nr:chromate resistance protein ChrB domain-containing protein [Mesoaciditoga lauensis]